MGGGGHLSACLCHFRESEAHVGDISDTQPLILLFIKKLRLIQHCVHDDTLIACMEKVHFRLTVGPIVHHFVCSFFCAPSGGEHSWISAQCQKGIMLVLRLPLSDF